MMIMMIMMMMLMINVDDDEDTNLCICARCTIRRRERDFRRNQCVKDEEHVPAFSNSGMYRFLEGVPMCGLSPGGEAGPRRGRIKK